MIDGKTNRLGLATRSLFIPVPFGYPAPLLCHATPPPSTIQIAFIPLDFRPSGKQLPVRPQHIINLRVPVVSHPEFRNKAIASGSGYVCCVVYVLCIYIILLEYLFAAEFISVVLFALAMFISVGKFC